MKYTFQTDSAADGLRIDACIRRFLQELPSRAAQEAFSHRDVKLDGKRVKPDVRVHAGQCVEVFCMEQTAPLLDVVYEDADVLLVDRDWNIHTVLAGGEIMVSDGQVVKQPYIS